MPASLPRALNMTHRFVPVSQEAKTRPALQQRRVRTGGSRSGKRRRVRTGGSRSGSSDDVDFDVSADESGGARRADVPAGGTAAPRAQALESLGSAVGGYAGRRAEIAPAERRNRPREGADGDVEEAFPAAGAVQAEVLGCCDEEASRDLRELYEMTRTDRVDENGGRIPMQELPSSYDYASLAKKLCAVYESLKDYERAAPIVEERRGAKPGLFCTSRLRALLRFVVRVGGSWLSERELVFLYELLDTWDGTRPRMVVDDWHEQKLLNVFPTPQCFVHAVKNDVTAAVLRLGWKRIRLTEGGVTYEGYFRPVLDVIMGPASASGVQLWSSAAGPAPSTNKRQTSMKGDAFRLSEAEVVKDNGPLSCTLGIHVYSDASLLSWSGGKFDPVFVAMDVDMLLGWRALLASDLTADSCYLTAKALSFDCLYAPVYILCSALQRTSCTLFG